MRKAGGIITLIAGILAVFAAGFTLLVGGAGSAFEAEGADQVVLFGVGGLVFAFLTIVFGAISMNAGSRWPAVLTILCALTGAVLGGSLVAIFMVLALIGGIVGLFGAGKSAASGAAS